ncbi:MAG: helix-turn-helix domain-containing protein [Thermoanaerobaculaceae bacterium]
METKWLTVVEAAQYLKMGRSTVYKLAQEGKLPTHKVGNQWRFDREEIDQWMNGRDLLQGKCLPE